MKLKTKIITVITTSILSLSAIAADIYLEWNVPTNAVKNINYFNIRATNSLPNVGITNAPILSSIPIDSPLRVIEGTNYVYKFDQNVVPGERYYVLSAVGSNFWGQAESFLSTNSTPAVIEHDLSNVSMKIKLGKSK